MKKLVKILIIIMLMTACQPVSNEISNPMPSESPDPTTEPLLPQNGGTLKISMRHPETLNPLLNEDVTVDRALRLMFEPMMILDETQKPIPNLLESVSLSTDGLSAIIKLKNNLYWHDGSQITTDDIIYSLDTLKVNATENSIYKNNVQNILSYSKTEEENSVRIIYSQPFGCFAYKLCFPIIPANHADTTAPIGNGIYTYDGSADISALKLKATTNALGKTPYIENIDLVLLSDKETDLYAFEQNLIDVVSANISDWGKYLSSKDTLAAEYITQYFDFIGFNFEKPLFQNKDMRMAIAHITDKDKLVSEVYAGHALPTKVPINPESWVYEQETTEYLYDMELAKSLLPTEIDNPIRILVNEENEERIKIANILVESMQQLGLTPELDVCNFDEYKSKLESKDFDIFIGGFNLSVIPDLTFAFHSTQKMNYFSYANSEVDSLLMQAFTAPSETEFKHAQSGLQKLLADDLPCISLVFRQSVLLTNRNIQGDKKPDLSNIYANIDEWFIIDTDTVER